MKLFIKNFNRILEKSVKLHCMATDSFVLSNSTKNVIDDWKKLVEKFDFNNLNKIFSEASYSSQFNHLRWLFNITFLGHLPFITISCSIQFVKMRKNSCSLSLNYSIHCNKTFPNEKLLYYIVIQIEYVDEICYQKLIKKHI